MSTLWPLILDQRVPHKKMVTLLIFTNTLITTIEVFRNKAKGLAVTDRKTREKGQKARNKMKDGKEQKKRKWTKGVGRCPLETDQI